MEREKEALERRIEELENCTGAGDNNTSTNATNTATNNSMSTVKENNNNDINAADRMEVIFFICVNCMVKLSYSTCNVEHVVKKKL